MISGAKGRSRIDFFGMAGGGTASSELFGRTETQRRGFKSLLAKNLECQPTFISQVLNGGAHLSLEQAERASVFIGQTAEEKTFLLLMVQKDRAGTPTLRQFFQEKMEKILADRLDLSQRLGSAREQMSEEQKSIYYSSWICPVSNLRTENVPIH